MSGKIEFIVASDGETVTPQITHECEVVVAPDGSYEQVYNFLDYWFRNLPDTTEARARVYYGERSASLYLNVEASPKSAELIVSYFKRRLFSDVTYLGPSGKYEPLWQREEHGTREH